MIDELIKFIPPSLQSRSGKVFYSGRNAYTRRSPVYILGVNPGGAPDEHATETVQSHTELVLRSLSADWSAYRDESWKGKAPGKAGMQPRILHLIDMLGLAPGIVPASNLVFARSSRESTFDGDILQMARECWPFHSKVIELLRPRIIVCLGSTAGNYVCGKLGATKQIDQFVEKNKRQWTSRLYSNGLSASVAVLTHPSIANWCSEATDPSGLVVRAIQNAA